MRIVRRRCWLGEVHVDLIVVGPQIDHLTRELRAIIAEQRFGSATEANEPVQNLDHILSSQAIADLDRQTFPGVNVDNRERSYFLAVRKLVVNEVEAPGFVERLRLASRLTVRRHLTAPRTLCLQD